MSQKVFQSMDGNQAAAYCAYAFTEVAGIYPITPSSPMPQYIDLWSSQGKKNLFGMPVKVIEMESEAGAAGSVHGSLLSGALTTTFTASQGLLLKVPNMYKIAGELLPGVMHVAARALATHALSIFGDHSDVMATRQTGWGMLVSGSVQEVMDLAGIAHLAAIESSVPFMHFFDGFRTSHEVEKIEVMDYAVFDKLLDKEKVDAFRARALNSGDPVIHGTAQNDDVFFQASEASNKFYDAIPDIVAKYMKAISKVTGRHYEPFNYYGDPEATDIIILMGSAAQCAEEVVDYLNKKGHKVGVLEVHLYRPFSAKYLLKAMPKSAERIAVLDRTKEPGSEGEPLYLDVKGVYYGLENAPKIVGGRYGLSSKDVSPRQIIAVYKNLEGKMKDHFTVGIEDDVTNLSLPMGKEVAVGDPSTTELLFFGLGSDGTVGACKDSIKLIGDNTSMYAQAYSSYDSKKSGGVTRMHLRFGKNPIKSTYLVNTPDFVSCSQDSYLWKYDMLSGIKKNGTFLLNTTYNDADLEAFMPNAVKKLLAERNIKFYAIDASALATSVGLKGKINTIMQSAFFKLNEQIIPYTKAVELMKYYAHKTYGRKGDAIVEMNYRAIEIGGSGIRQVPVKKEWIKLGADPVQDKGYRPDFVKNIAEPVNAIKGYDLPVSAFKGYEDGLMPSGTAQYEKRTIASDVPAWDATKCIQCNLCSFACPHACIRPFLVTEEEKKNAPEGATYAKANGKGLENYSFRMQISVEDCTGCGVCINVCPAKPEKALHAVPIHAALESPEVKLAHYFYDHVSYKGDLVGRDTPKNLMFSKPMFEFSGACAGCGETPYVKNVTQLFGERMVIANATGCSSIYGASFPASPYTTNAEGRGPAWANSLFEDNAEFGYGITLGNKAMRDKVQVLMDAAHDKVSTETAALFDEWKAHRNDGNYTLELSKRLVAALENEQAPEAKAVLHEKQYFVKQSNWIFGGDGWAYDIGYGGLDHVIANNEDVNIMVVDTEVYSNTGGQSSKSSRTGSIAQFTASGKVGKKKDLANIAISYGHVYVATIAHGANPAQMVKALKEAESYPGPSLIIAYAPCIEHGINKGMGTSSLETKLAVECGYFPLFRFDPRLKEQGKNPFQLDSKTPDWSKYNDFLMGERRYNTLSTINPTAAQELLKENIEHAQARFAVYQDYANRVYGESEEKKAE